MNSEQGGDPRTELSGATTFTNRGEQSMPSALSGPEGAGSPGGSIAKKVKARDCSKRGSGGLAQKLRVRRKKCSEMKHKGKGSG